MEDIVKKNYWRRLKNLSYDHFWQALNELHSRAYEYAVEHVFEAMGMHPRISKPMIDMNHEHIWAEQYCLDDNMELQPDGEICERCGEVKDESTIQSSHNCHRPTYTL